MRIASTVLKALDMRTAAAGAISTPIEKFPRLISERALESAADVLAAHVTTAFGTYYTPGMEVISMPKKNFGPRPIGLLSPIGKTMYNALVSSLQHALPVPSRAQGYEQHRAFGTEASRTKTQRIVIVDIAACYEYIDHEILSDELLLQSLQPEKVEALSLFLGTVYPRQLGIPQAQEPSHLLADAYLTRLERGLLRAGYELNRFADDFRLVTDDWADAHRSIEVAAEQARRLGLTLSDGKTDIRSSDQLRAEEASYEASLTNYRESAAESLSSFVIVERGYDDYDFEVTEAAPEDIDFTALERVVEDWISRDRERTDGQAYFARYGAVVLDILARAPRRIKTRSLVEIVTREPLRLTSVLGYLGGRSEAKKNWKVLRKLTRLERLSPWARIWILNAVADLSTPATPGKSSEEAVYGWVESCLEDEFEAVRAEAAWVLACVGRLNVDQLGKLVGRATDLTHFGLSAVIGRLDGATQSKLGKSVKGSSKLAAAAYAWGQAFAS